MPISQRRISVRTLFLHSKRNESEENKKQTRALTIAEELLLLPHTHRQTRIQSNFSGERATTENERVILWHLRISLGRLSAFARA